MAKAKYPVIEYVGVPVEQDQSGQYVIKDQTDFQLHSWRTGRHTKGKFKQLGQVFLTENGLSVAVVATHPVAYKDRHGITPMQRFTSETVADAVLKLAQSKLV